MKKLHILHLGIGNVGTEVVMQVTQQKEKLKKSFGVSFHYVHQFTSKNPREEINDAIRNIASPFVLIDTTASDKTIPYIAKALRRGGFAILVNKKPLSGKQIDFNLLHSLGGERLFYECVVGAGLPVIRTLKDIILTDDEIVEIQGCFSGTLGYIFSQLDKGTLFSEAVLAANKKGFTEPDPRDDLSGIDVVRKALILARLLSRKIELEDILLEGLFPAKMQKLSAKDFLKNLPLLDMFYKEKVENTKRKGKVLRFVAKVRPHDCCVGLQEIDTSSDIGSLKGPDNLIVFKTKRYLQNPLIIKGPGAGRAVTAAGVFADLLLVAKMVQGGNV